MATDDMTPAYPDWTYRSITASLGPFGPFWSALGSWIARLGIPVGSLYSSTKGAIETLTTAWAAEFGPTGVRVNAISPGVIRTPAVHGDTHPAEAMMRGTPAGRSGTPDEVAHAAVYLASDESSFVHGTVVDVDGGRVAVAVVTS